MANNKYFFHLLVIIKVVKEPYLWFAIILLEIQPYLCDYEKKTKKKPVFRMLYSLNITVKKMN